MKIVSILSPEFGIILDVSFSVWFSDVNCQDTVSQVNICLKPNPKTDCHPKDEVFSHLNNQKYRNEFI